MNKHLILGTAGHVDHGKTALTKALTNIECDTHPEEKARGITINLGFAHLDLSNGDSLGIVDVPGHRDFVNTMIAGANGIDFVLLVVAADSGVMPQTLEHLQIMQILGIKAGAVALTKIDRVDEDSAELAEEDVMELIEGTFLEDCPIIRVSAITGEGITELREQLEQLASRAEPRLGGSTFRMFIDRVFSISGFGTVVTGSVLGGQVSTGDKLFLLPGGRELRVRRIERHGETIDQTSAGDRASLNVVGMSRDDYQRGMILSDRLVQPTTMVDVSLDLFERSPELGTWTQVVFVLGTFSSQGKVHLLDSDHLQAGSSGIAQIHLDSPCVANYGDRFVIRSSSSDITLGGGELIDAHPLLHKRRPDSLIRQLREIVKSGLSGRVTAEVKKHPTPVNLTEVAEALDVSGQQVLDGLAKNQTTDIAVVASGHASFLLPIDRKIALQEELLGLLEKHHGEHPLEEGGRTWEELRGIFGTRRNSNTDAVTKLVLEELVENTTLKRVDRTFALDSHQVRLSDQDRDEIGLVEKFLKNSGMQIPLMSKMTQAAEREGVSEPRLRQLLAWLAANDRVYIIDGNYLHHSVVDRCRDLLTQHFDRSDEGVTVSSFRDLVGGNRKISLLLLAQFDNEGLTIRVGDVRSRRH